MTDSSKFDKPDLLLELGFLYPKTDDQARFMKVGIRSVSGFETVDPRHLTSEVFIRNRSVSVSVPMSSSKYPVVLVNVESRFSIVIPWKIAKEYYYSDQINNIWVAPAVEVRLAIIDAVGQIFDNACECWNVEYESRTHVVFKGISGRRFDNS